MPEVPINSRKGVVGMLLIDEIDLDIVEGKSVHMQQVRAGKGRPYPVVKRDGKGVPIHRAIGDRMGIAGNVKRKNGNYIDCRRENLIEGLTKRSDPVVKIDHTPRKESYNVARTYLGVKQYGRCSRYRAEIVFEGRVLSLGTFGNQIHAARAFDSKAIELFGDKAVTNASLGKYA